MLKPWCKNAHGKEFYTAWYTVKEDSYCLIGRDQFEDLDVDGNIVSKWTLQQRNWHMWISFGTGQTPVVGSCEYADKPSGFIKQEKFCLYEQLQY